MPSGIRVEDIKGWLWKATQKEQPVMHRWANVVRIIQLEFAEGVLLEDLTWGTMVLLPKGRGGIWVSGWWKLCESYSCWCLNQG